MPRGRGSRGGGHKGQRRHFTNPEALEREREKEERERKWRQQKGDGEESEEEEAGGEDKEKKEEGSDSEESESEEDDDSKAKGVQHLIDIENPNRAVKKNKKVETLTVEEAPDKQQLSRREREELEKQKARAHYMKMHAAGKTEEAREDLARLALIRKQREEMAKKRDDEKKTKDAAKVAKTQEINKALGKKT